MIYFTIDQLTPAITPKDQIVSLCKMHGPELSGKFIENKAGFLYALSGIETDYGRDNIPRYELAYGPGGLYYQKSRILKENYSKYGALACCSWGPWQILYQTAWETQKFNDHPALLHSGGVSLPLVIGHLNYLISLGADTIDKLAASYNAGPLCLKEAKFWPKRYVLKFLDLYDMAVRL